ncbi:MaoC protein [[Haemophilus] ducreyi]|uniref:type II secretion system F family protein n=1 Tax=Haemophilus ducreyi TaxID=730 RepID=UPI0006556FB0|nr:type II secretion system F family protein [[Haemophilus] ducreyi]AKO36873.1 MaoC protein [[Haemophilus] ducreyi]AKO38340.1 MaoC protein [[Haemophilus] ducreyi]AKO41355.1 MaoC protein [[Haemophilus] ducreyi]AKO42830.1 MaoC protein [[Haemophilus] ducreyi]ANF70652.1 protein dehydratase [[Haemophilus] ducreyi]
MILLYYLVFGFGGLLLLLTITSWLKTRKQIQIRETNFNQKVRQTFNTFEKNVKLWFYYLSGSGNNHLIRNLMIHFAIFVGLYYANAALIRFDNQSFMIAELIGFVMLVWKMGQRRNKKMFDETFPEVIQILNAATSSGVSLLQAMERCGKDISGPLGQEFTLIYKRLARGEDAMAVFQDSYSRYPYKSFYFFICIIRTNLSRGGQIREVVSRLGRAIADANKMEQKKKAMTAEARMSVMIVACFPVFFFFFMKFMTPENFDFMMNDPGGRIILYYVVGSELLGIFTVWWLMRKAS